eukprot:TRINITY_DN6987_c0_g1_i12.p1 TRINITY_DN6987_c0_g1~~TRINITY_DN6987_c0_g1_i12.p1  ORF type:complete len:250 (-),score=56.66 TRINITY_DN6987_c0_g1_i12:47-796(-)
MADQFQETYGEVVKEKEYSEESAGDIMKEILMNYKDKLEMVNLGHSFYIYTMISDHNKLVKRTVALLKSDGEYDSAVNLFMNSENESSPDCMCLLSAVNYRPGNVDHLFKKDKENIQSEAKAIVVKEIAGKTLSEEENKIIANSIAKGIKDMMINKKYAINCMIGVIVIDPEVKYKDGVMISKNQDMEQIQISYKTYQFNVIILIVAVPYDTITNLTCFRWFLLSILYGVWGFGAVSYTHLTLPTIYSV